MAASNNQEMRPTRSAWVGNLPGSRAVRNIYAATGVLLAGGLGWMEAIASGAKAEGVPAWEINASAVGIAGGIACSAFFAAREHYALRSSVAAADNISAVTESGTLADVPYGDNPETTPEPGTAVDQFALAAVKRVISQGQPGISPEA